MNQSNKIYKKDRLNEDRERTWLRISQPGSCVVVNLAYYF